VQSPEKIMNMAGRGRAKVSGLSRGAVKKRSDTEKINEELIKHGLDPSEFPTFKDKQEVLAMMADSISEAEKMAEQNEQERKFAQEAGLIEPKEDPPILVEVQGVMDEEGNPEETPDAGTDKNEEVEKKAYEDIDLSDILSYSSGYAKASKTTPTKVSAMTSIASDKPTTSFCNHLNIDASKIRNTPNEGKDGFGYSSRPSSRGSTQEHNSDSANSRH